jgi:trehalose/maltose transport system substrate-binding protein
MRSSLRRLAIALVSSALSCAFNLSGANAAQAPVIAEWPTALRTDLRGMSLRVVLPENAPDRVWDDALMAKFEELTGIKVTVIRPGNDTTAALAKYLKDFRSGTPQGDVYAIDIVWPGILNNYAEDLKPAFGGLPGVLQALAKNDTVRGKLVAVPYFVEISLLYYRKDLLKTYHFEHPPQTWGELEEQSRAIEESERARGNAKFWGYLWQGAASEALTCNALEWQASQAGGLLLKSDRTGTSIDLNRDRTVAILSRARGWVGTISPPEVTDQLEDDSLALWKRGGAAFMRNWPYAYQESMGSDSSVAGQVGVTVMPAGDVAGAPHADTLGGFQLMVSNRSKNKAGAIELIRFLTSPEIQRVNAATRGYAPTIPHLYDHPAVLKANPFFAALKQVLVESAVSRPSTLGGARYDEVSRAYFSAVHEVLEGKVSPLTGVNEIEAKLREITARKRDFAER